MPTSRQEKKGSRGEEGRGARRTHDPPVETTRLADPSYGGAADVERLGLDNELCLGPVPEGWHPAPRDCRVGVHRSGVIKCKELEQLGG